MREYTHTSSPVIEKIEANFESEAAKKYDLPILHDMYEQVRYRFLPANAVYKMMVDEHYPPTIEVGTPCTVYYYSDHRAATVTKVDYYKDGRKDAAGNRIPKLIGTNLNEVKCLDFYAGKYEVLPMTGKDLGLVHNEFTIRKHGRWISKGNQTGDGLSLGIGYWNHYIDPCF